MIGQKLHAKNEQRKGPFFNMIRDGAWYMYVVYIDNLFAADKFGDVVFDKEIYSVSEASFILSVRQTLLAVTYW